MLGKLTILSTFGDSYYDAVESMLGLSASTEYLVNTDNIIKFKLQGTTDSYIKYKLNIYEDRSPEFILLVDETNANIVTLADATPASVMLALQVYEGALTFGDCASLSTTTYYYNIDSIVWGSENEAGTITRLLVAEGGFAVKAIFVNHDIDQIVDWADTGSTTTTSTSSTSTTAEATTTGG